MNEMVARARAAAAGFMREWARHEHAPRSACPECHFESSEGYPPSHAPGCPLAPSDPPSRPRATPDPAPPHTGPDARQEPTR